MIDIYLYLDYRKYLQDFLGQQKSGNASFSFRRFARESGIDSGYITRIIAGKRHISLSLARKIAGACGLDRKQTRFFCLLVQFGKAKTQSEKSLHFKKILTNKSSTAAVLSENQYGLFDNWYNLAVREMVACFPFRGDCADLGKRISPPISEAKARKAIALLEKLGLVGKNAEGVYERIEKVWTTNTAMESVVVNRFQMDMLALAQESYDRFPRRLRDMSTLTLSVSGAEYDAMVQELAALRKRFLAMAMACRNPDRVYHLDLALFPLSNNLHTEEKKQGVSSPVRREEQ